MSDTDKISTFRLELPELVLELVGEKKVVERLYQSISADLLPVVFPSRRGGPSPPTITEPPPAVVDRHQTDYTWLYVCTTFYNKVYAVENAQLARGVLGECLDVSLLSRVYLDELPESVLESFTSRPRTLWSEFTEAGKARFRTPDGD